MKRLVLVPALLVALSGFALGQPAIDSSQGKLLSARPQLVSARSPQDEQANDHQSKQAKKQSKKEGKKARKRQKKEDEKLRKEQAKEQKKDIKKQNKEIAKEQQKSLKKQNEQIAKEQKKQPERAEKEQKKRANKSAKPQSVNENASAAAPRPSSDRDQQNTAQSQARNAPPPSPSGASEGNRVRTADEDRDRQKREAERNREDRERDLARARDEERRREADRHYAARRGGEGIREAIPVSSTANPGALAAQRNVSRAIYSQIPNSNVMVLVNNNNQIVLRGAAATPSLRHRLLQLAMGAAGGYSIVDQLAANAVGSAAGAATDAAIGGVSGLIHGSGSGPGYSPGSDYSGADNGTLYAQSQESPYGPPPSDNSQYGPQGPYDDSQTPYDKPQSPYGTPGPDTTSDYGPPPSDNFGAYSPGTPVNGLGPGTNGCINVYGNDQVLLTGQVNSQADWDRMQQFAQQVGGRNATVINQLAMRTNGGNTASSPGTSNPANPSANGSTGSAVYDRIVSQGSIVCVNVDDTSQVLLTGTVGSPAQIGNVERAAQPMLGANHLIDQLTTGAIEAASSPSGVGGTTGTAAAPDAAPNNAPASNGAIGAPSQPNGAAATGQSVPVAENQVEQALHSIPRLSNVDAEVTATTVRLTGSVDGPGDEQMARDIVHQYAPGRQLVDNLTVNRDRTNR